MAAPVAPPPGRRRGRLGVWLVLGGLVLVAVVVANVVRSMSDGGSREGRRHSDAVPLPTLTAVPATGAPPVEPTVEGDRVPVRLEVTTVDGAAGGPARVSWAVGTGDDERTEESATLPWATQAVAGRDGYLRVSAFPTASEAPRTLLCRVLVGGVVVVQERGADYVSCSTSVGQVLGR